MSVRPTELATAQDVAALRAPLDLRRRDHVRVTALLVALGVGLRRGEVCALNVGDFRTHESRPVLHVSTLKRRGEMKRLVPLCASDAALVAKYVSQQHGRTPNPTAPLFVTSSLHYPFTTRRLTPKAVAYWITRLRRDARINKRLTPHSLRHGYATGLLRTKTDLKTVQELLGHASVTSTQVYLHSSFDLKVQATERLARG